MSECHYFWKTLCCQQDDGSRRDFKQRVRFAFNVGCGPQHRGKRCGMWFAFKWLLPVVFFFVCSKFCTVMLSLATHQYVSGNFSKDELVDNLNDALGEKVYMDASDMDTPTLILPVIVTIGIFCSSDLRLWTKVFLCWGYLLALKGLLGWCTILPDASSFEECRHRLGEETFEYFSDEDRTTGELIGCKCVSFLPLFRGRRWS